MMAFISYFIAYTLYVFWNVAPEERKRQGQKRQKRQKGQKERAWDWKIRRRGEIFRF